MPKKFTATDYVNAFNNIADECKANRRPNGPLHFLRDAIEADGDLATQHPGLREFLMAEIDRTVAKLRAMRTA